MTYIIQYRKNADAAWRNFVDEDNNNVEFVSYNGARAVVFSFANNDYEFPSRITDFQILDSTGKIRPIEM